MADLRATPRNRLLGLLADVLAPVADYLTTSTNPVEDAGTDFSLTGLLGGTIKPLAVTADRMSYGEPLTTGRGYTTQLRPETRDVLLGAAPMVGPTGKAAVKGAKVAAKELSPQAERMIMDYAMKMGGIKPAIVWHGSPYKFDKFKTSEIGSGEGAQAFGHGLYFADKKGIAEDYARTLAGNSPDFLLDGVPTSFVNVFKKARKFMDEDAYADLLETARYKKQFGRDHFLDWLNNSALDTVNEVFDGAYYADKAPGYLYKAEIPDDAIKNMILWDRPFSQQPDSVKKAALNLKSADQLERLDGDEIYRIFTKGNPNAEKELVLTGVPGIRYLDATSRNAGQGSMNTVLFDDSLVKILERNGVPIKGLID